MGNRFPFGMPSGWYAVATSDEVAPGSVLARHYFERDLAIYRTRSGVVSVVDAFCPHLGAHLGKLGKVDGETLQCGFHGFRFATDGSCIATGYDGPPPPGARLTHWNHRELNGLILVWFDPEGRDPTWEVQPLDETGWIPMRAKRYHLRTHPQETTENSVDFGHFTRLHGFIDGELTQPVRTDGPVLTTSYAAYRPYRVPGRSPLRMRVEYDVLVEGLGYSQVEVRIPFFGLDLRVWVLPVPVDGEHIELVIGAASRSNLGPLAPLVRYFVHKIVCKEVDQDLQVWEHKAYHARPALAKGDSPVGTYRQWVKQFYPQTR